MSLELYYSSLFSREHARGPMAALWLLCAFAFVSEVGCGTTQSEELEFASGESHVGEFLLLCDNNDSCMGGRVEGLGCECSL